MYDGWKSRRDYCLKGIVDRLNLNMQFVKEENE